MIQQEPENLDGIAVVGMSGRFPGAKNVEQFWQNLVNGIETVSLFREDELEFTVASPDAVALGQTFIRARAILDDVDQFDASFFGIYPREAELMDPQHRLFLECAWETLESGGYDPDRYPGMIGVYAGLSLNTYLLYNLCADRAFAANFAGNYQVGLYQVMLGNDKDFMPTRVSYRLNLRGPSMSIQSACSTSLVAICQACTSLLNYQCDMALAGGVSITFPQKRDYLYQDGAMVSADGACRVFDADASGTVFGHGVAVVLLKRMADAVADGDSILAVIKGTALNNDGSMKIGYAAPSVNAQAEVIAMAQAAAGVDPETISYIEAHGTATPLGDPIEIAALTQAFRGGGARRNCYCAIGTGKTHIGHIDVAAGATGLIKTILQLQHELIPPLLHFRSPNPKIDFANSPFFPVIKLMEWKRGESPRRAGVSAFGVGGTNAHVVVEEAPLPAPGGPSRPQQLLVLSAKTDSALQAMTANLAVRLEGQTELDLADAAFTLQSGRKQFAYRRAIVASDTTEAINRLRSLDTRTVATGRVGIQEPSIVFLFPGQGAQYLNMGRELYNSEAVFREAADCCADILQRSLGLDLRTVLYPNSAATLPAETQINQTWLAQPAIFVVEYALARLWMSWGVRPAVLIGHSIGEYVAAVLAEAFTLEDALALLSERARLMQSLPAGSMLAVRLGACEVERILPEGASIAAVNSPVLCVVSGPTYLIQEFQQKMESEGVAARFLHTSHAFHSAMMEPMLPEFAAAARQTLSQPPKLPWVSTSTGRWMRSDDLADGDYWVRQVRQTVRFTEAIELVIEDAHNIMLEVGPSQTLSQLARQHAKKPADATVISSMGSVAESGHDVSSILAALGRLWVAGVSINWGEFSSKEQRRRITLPTYPFERKRYWIEPATFGAMAPHAIEPTPSETCQIKESKVQIVQDSSIVATKARKDRLLNELCDLFQSYSGTDYSQTDPKESFMDLGLDSLLLTQVSQGVLKRFGVKVTFRQMLGAFCTLDSLAAFLDEKMPPDVITPPVLQPATVQAVKAVSGSAVTNVAMAMAVPSQIPSSSMSGSLLETVIQQQMAIMTQQLNLLRKEAVSGAEHADPASPDVARSNTAPAMPVITAVNLEKHSHFGPFKAIEKGAAGGLTERQQVALDKLVDRYNRRTAKSKTLAQQHRAYFCDPRAAGNFRQLWKEMVYPISCTRSKGSRIWDIDGNEYIDITMGFGANYLGHSPDFVMQAVEAQMKLGVEIGPQSPIAGEVARMICEFTGMDRVTFCNTGSEAVMAAFRVARTVTGREKIVYFYGDYHGIFDEVLGRPALFDGMPGAMPIAPGIPHLANMMILEYGNPSSLDAIRRHADEIAAVIVEPVQSRHPELQPREFLQTLGRLTRDHEIALIFDEVITGFRVAPGGAQEYFGVKADLATYGKVIGGGMPIGVLAGSATYMDALDGGFWEYGDDSSPPTGVTFFAGTFVRHPLAMAAAYAVLKHLKSAGPELQEQTNKRTARFVENVNRFFQGRELPMQLRSFSAMFYYDFHSDLRYAGLLFYYLRDRGVHIWEGRVGHLSVAHTDSDMNRVLLAIQESVEEMQAGGFLPESGSHSAAQSDQKSTAVVTRGLGAMVPAERISPVASRFALAEAQREMWIGAQMKPEAAGSHHACTGIYLDGDIDVESLRRAIRAVVQRHEGLRCTFSEEGTEAILHAEPMPEVTLHDLSDLPEPQREERMNEILHQEGRRLLDLTKGPLVNFKILKLSTQRHMLIFTAQMIVCDGWSHYVVFEDLGALYTSFAKGEEPYLESVVPMREFALWEQANARSIEACECEAFWLSQFKTVPTPIDFPTAHSRPPSRTFEGDRQVLTLPAELCRSIRKLAKEQKNSYFAVFLAAFQAWLYRISGASDIVVGVPFAAQSQLGMDTLVGQCANILPLRTQIEPTESFSSLSVKTWSSVLDAQEHWNFTYGRLIPSLDLPRDSSRIPLVSVLFNIDPPMSKVKFWSLKHRFITGPRYYFQYDMGFNLIEDGDTINVECDYNRNLFDGDVILSWVAGYQALLEKVVEKPDLPVDRLPMMNERETQRLLSFDACLETTDVPVLAIDGMFKAQARISPDAISVTGEGGSLTYRELDRRSNCLGNYLVTLGVGSNAVVGVCMDRTTDLPVAMLSILKAGGAYVLIDTSSSIDEVIHLVNDIGALIVLLDDHARSRFPATDARMVYLNKGITDQTHESDVFTAAVLDSDRLACIICKDCSQGGTQRVEITHRAIVNCLLSMKRELGMVTEDEVLCHSPLSCGLDIIEIWLPLVAGARTSIYPNTIICDLDGLRLTIEKQNVTVMLATPSIWRMLLNSGCQPNRRLRALCWGEALQSGIAGRLAEVCKEVWNVYGATETTFGSMIGRAQTGVPITLGQPVDNTHVVLVDERFELVPVGVPGEILVSGNGLARGYRGLPALTAEKFIYQSIGGQSPNWFFRTEDMARYCSDGTMEFIGRMDQRKKVRGFIFEPVGIESIILAHSAVRDAVVSYMEDIDGSPGVIAYILLDTLTEKTVFFGTAELIKEIRRLVRSRLPEYMLPARFVVLETIPRRPDGRVDYAALPAPTEADSIFEDYVAPRNKTEEILAGIWQELLKLNKVSVKDSFFDLGGQSLLAVRLFNRIENEFGRRFPLAVLFRAPTIDQLARKLTAYEDTASEWPSLVPIQPHGSKTPIFLVHGAGGNVLLYRALTKRLEPDYPVYGLQSQGLDGHSKPLQTIEAMADRYLQEIRTIQPVGPYLLGGYCLGGSVAYEMAQHLVAGGEKVAMVAMFDTYNFIRALKVDFTTFLKQKARFHWSNLVQLRPSTMWRYLREKKRIAGDGGWAHIGTEMPGTTIQDGVARAESGIEASVQELNDHAADIYDPRPYSGVLTLFKPHINYKFYPDPKLGWGDLAVGGLDIVELPLNPHAMLVEPYVELLSRELKARLDRLDK